jgi:glycosyltransferase involved in cell wall biosynthesis
MVAPTSFFADYGCHVRILEEARILRERGHKVTITTYFNGRDLDGLDIRRTLPIPWRQDYEVGSSRHKLGFDALLGWTTLKTALLMRPKPDVIHGHLHEGALIGGIVARILRKPLVFDFQGSLSAEMVDHGFLDPAGRVYGPMRKIERFIDHLPQTVVTSSSHAAEHLHADYGVPRHRLVALPDCVNTQSFRPAILSIPEREAAKRALGIPEGRSVVVYLGLLAAHQGTDILLEAARRVVEARPETHFLIMGFPGVEVYAARAAEMGILDHLTFTGRIPYEDAPARLSLGDLAVAPKISTTEGSGKLLNYMAMGLPTVAFDLPVCREYMGEDGQLVPAGNQDAFADAILGLLNDPARSRRMGDRLRERSMLGYDWQRGGELLEQVYRRVIRGRNLQSVIS